MDTISANYALEDDGMYSVSVLLPKPMADFCEVPVEWELELEKTAVSDLKGAAIDQMLERASEMDLPIELYEELERQLEDGDWTVEEVVGLEGEAAAEMLRRELFWKFVI